MGKCISKSKSFTRSDKRKESLLRIASEDLDDSFPEIEAATVIKKIPKEQSKQLILSSLQNHHLFSSLDPENMDVLYKKFKLYYIPVGEVIFEQGSKGKIFYILETGMLEVFRNNIKKTILKEGDTFGEMAILTNGTRRTAIRTVENSTL